MTTLEKIRAKLHETAEMHEDGDYYLRDKWVDEIIDKYAEQEPCEDCDYSEIMDWEQDAKTGKAKPIYWCERHKEPCDDVVSREWLKKKLQEHHDFFVDAYGGFKNMTQTDKARVDEITNCIAEVVNAPSVRPQEQTGHWINRHIIANTSIDMIVCSECGEEFSYDAETGISEYNYCPNCGARMESDK